jgi:hypothetical protein
MLSPELKSNLFRLLTVIPVHVMWVLANVIIASTMASIVFIQLVAVAGWSKNASLGVAILTAIAVMVYIWLQPKIRTYLLRS